MFQASAQTIALIILGPIAVLYIIKHIMAWFHAKKSKIDEFQKMAARGAGVCRQAQLAMLSEILINAAALDLDDGAAAMKTAMKSVDTMPELMESLKANLIWQIDFRAKTPEGVKLIVDAILASGPLRAGILAGIEVEDEEKEIATVRKEAIKAAMPKAKTPVT